MKICNLDCEYQHEGCCIGDLCIEGFKPDDCKAETNDDLISVLFTGDEINTL